METLELYEMEQIEGGDVVLKQTKPWQQLV